MLLPTLFTIVLDNVHLLQIMPHWYNLRLVVWRKRSHSFKVTRYHPFSRNAAFLVASVLRWTSKRVVCKQEEGKTQRRSELKGTPGTIPLWTEGGLQLANRWDVHSASLAHRASGGKDLIRTHRKAAHLTNLLRMGKTKGDSGGITELCKGQEDHRQTCYFLSQNLPVWHHRK